MRLRNVKNKEEILNNSKYLVKDYNKYFGKWKTLFKNNNPIYIEIGMGKGKFIRENAIKYPNINFIGIEKYDSVVAKCLPKIEGDINNLLIIRMDALDIDKVFDHEIDRIYLNFSDPWPKKRHHLRRLSSKVFLDKYNNIFKNNKEIHMRTDNKELFEYSLISLSKKGYILEDVSLDLHSKNEEIITTEYEDKFSSLGMPIYSLKAIKSVKNNK
ncbi:MAG: tRNA (guanosine(46)-N7)-methyltransferase TrmB [Bacilli bacterium]|nr:tRNA (guanosine(46)-N7)-methyltransferase TrmB [Bacilli bacterium]